MIRQVTSYQSIVVQMSDGTHIMRVDWLQRPNWAAEQLVDVNRFRGNAAIVRATLFEQLKVPRRLAVPR